ncbi:MAG: serine O-acetyltransferase [Lachnospiraceae bacterium]|nr:serine O-acetyltransferase [Lachnospiraceae bacterium]
MSRKVTDPIRDLKKFIREETKVIRERDPAIHSDAEVFLYPSFHAIFWYRLAHRLYQKGYYFPARLISQLTARKTGIEIHPGAKIGKGLFIDHGHGVVIGETSEIGDNVTLYQGVTLGGTGKEKGKRHPTLGDNVMVSAGAKVLGSFEVGENSKIGAGSVVIQPVPPNSTVVGVPGHVVERKDHSAPQTKLQHEDLPDPLETEIENLKAENAELRSMIDEIKKKLEERDA